MEPNQSEVYIDYTFPHTLIECLRFELSVNPLRLDLIYHEKLRSISSGIISFAQATETTPMDKRLAVAKPPMLYDGPQSARILTLREMRQTL